MASSTARIRRSGLERQAASSSRARSRARAAGSSDRGPRPDRRRGGVVGDHQHGGADRLAQLSGAGEDLELARFDRIARRELEDALADEHVFARDGRRAVERHRCAG